MNVVAIALCCLTIFMLSGAIYDLSMPEANPKFAFLAVALIYGAGLFGLNNMYVARHSRHPWLQLVVGMITLMLAYASLEILLLTGFGR